MIRKLRERREERRQRKLPFVPLTDIRIILISDVEYATAAERLNDYHSVMEKPSDPTDQSSADTGEPEDDALQVAVPERMAPPSEAHTYASRQLVGRMLGEINTEGLTDEELAQLEAAKEQHGIVDQPPDS